MISASSIRYAFVDMHTAGEPVRIVTDGLPCFEGETVLAKRRDAHARFDHVRRHLMLEPRGHPAMYGVLPINIEHSDAALSVLFTHNEGFSTMCGHAVIALGRWLVDSGQVEIDTPVTDVTIDCPCGAVPVSVNVDKNGQTGSTALVIEDAFAATLDTALDTAEFGPVCVDIGFGGAFYAVLPASRLGLDFYTTPYEQLVEAARGITRAGQTQLELDHPDFEDLAFLYGTVLTDDMPYTDDARSCNLCAFGGGQVDRSATGSGVAARLAIAHARGEATAGLKMRFAGISGAGFGGEITAETTRGVSVRVNGRAHYAGRGELFVEPDDVLASGFEIPETLSHLR